MQAWDELVNEKYDWYTSDQNLYGKDKTKERWRTSSEGHVPAYAVQYLFIFKLNLYT